MSGLVLVAAGKMDNLHSIGAFLTASPTPWFVRNVVGRDTKIGLWILSRYVYL